MDDLVFLTVAFALFAVSALYVRACARLVGAGADGPPQGQDGDRA